jgi:hypothetical protein
MIFNHHQRLLDTLLGLVPDMTGLKDPETMAPNGKNKTWMTLELLQNILRNEANATDEALAELQYVTMTEWRSALDRCTCRLIARLETTPGPIVLVTEALMKTLEDALHRGGTTVKFKSGDWVAKYVRRRIENELGRAVLLVDDTDAEDNTATLLAHLVANLSSDTLNLVVVDDAGYGGHQKAAMIRRLVSHLPPGCMPHECIRIRMHVVLPVCSEMAETNVRAGSSPIASDDVAVYFHIRMNRTTSVSCPVDVRSCTTLVLFYKVPDGNSFNKTWGEILTDLGIFVPPYASVDVQSIVSACA